MGVVGKGIGGGALAALVALNVGLMTLPFFLVFVAYLEREKMVWKAEFLNAA